MTRRETVIKTLKHQKTEAIPYHIDFTEQSLQNLIAYTKDPQIEEKLGSCLNYIQYWGWPTELSDRPGYFQDEFGVIWNRTGADKDIGVVCNTVIEDLEDYHYTFPTCDEARLRREYEQLVAAAGDRFTMAGFGFCLFERAWSLMGMPNVLCSMLTCPEETEQFFDDICDYYLHLIDIALEYPIDGVYFGDDWGQQKGLLMGPEHWRRFIKPRVAKFYAKVKEKGLFIMQHSCGDCHEIFPDLIEIGLDCYQTFQPEIYDVAKMKRLYGDKLTFWGGISTQVCLPYATPEGVKREAIRIAHLLQENGGLILAPTHALPFDVPPENIMALVDVFQNQNQYF